MTWRVGEEAIAIRDLDHYAFNDIKVKKGQVLIVRQIKNCPRRGIGLIFHPKTKNKRGRMAWPVFYPKHFRKPVVQEFEGEEVGEDFYRELSRLFLEHPITIKVPEGRRQPWNSQQFVTRYAMGSSSLSSLFAAAMGNHD